MLVFLVEAGFLATFVGVFFVVFVAAFVEPVAFLVVFLLAADFFVVFLETFFEDGAFFVTLLVFVAAGLLVVLLAVFLVAAFFVVFLVPPAFFVGFDVAAGALEAVVFFEVVVFFLATSAPEWPENCPWRRPRGLSPGQKSPRVGDLPTGVKIGEAGISSGLWDLVRRDDQLA